MFISYGRTGTFYRKTKNIHGKKWRGEASVFPSSRSRRLGRLRHGPSRSRRQGAPCPARRSPGGGEGLGAPPASPTSAGGTSREGRVAIAWGTLSLQTEAADGCVQTGQGTGPPGLRTFPEEAGVELWSLKQSYWGWSDTGPGAGVGPARRCRRRCLHFANPCPEAWRGGCWVMSPSYLGRPLEKRPTASACCAALPPTQPWALSPWGQVGARAHGKVTAGARLAAQVWAHHVQGAGLGTRRSLLHHNLRGACRCLPGFAGKETGCSERGGHLSKVTQLAAHRARMQAPTVLQTARKRGRVGDSWRAGAPPLPARCWVLSKQGVGGSQRLAPAWPRRGLEQKS